MTASRKPQRQRIPKPVLKMTTVPEGTPQHLDKLLRWQAREFDHSWERLEPLIVEAKAREIHTDLGFKSWPDYIADVTRREMPNVSRSVEQRRELVALLSREGMSQRAIAEAVGVSNATVSRDQAEAEQVLHDVTPEPAENWVKVTVVNDNDKGREPQPVPLSPEEHAQIRERLSRDRELIEAQYRARGQTPPGNVIPITAAPATVTGLDGKTYPKQQKPKPKPQNTFADRFYRALSQLQSDALRLQLLTKEKGFTEHINDVTGHRDGVVWVAEIVTDVLAKLQTDQGDLFGDHHQAT